MTNDTPRTLTGAVADELTALKAVRRDVTNDLLAQAAGLSTRQVIRILRGKADISLPELEAFAGVLNVNVRTIIDNAYGRL